jgi:soluble lytic murein transglycosylase-like protein
VLLLGVAAESAREVSRSGASADAATASVSSACPLPAAYRRAFARAAAATHLPLSVLAAVAYEESRLDPAARSHAGARGLLQVMPGTARALQLARSSPEANILAGARYLKQLVARFGNLDLALAAYNAGPTAVERAGAAPSLAVLRYVKNVEARAATLWTSC